MLTPITWLDAMLVVQLDDELRVVVALVRGQRLHPFDQPRLLLGRLPHEVLAAGQIHDTGLGDAEGQRQFIPCIHDQVQPEEGVRRGVLPSSWDVAVDGTPLESGAHSFGRKVCACVGKRCVSRRYFSDPAALLGWDSYRHRYYFGYNLMALTVANAVPGQPCHPLVVGLALHPANRSDAVAYPDLLVKTQHRLVGTDGPIRRVIGDAAFDVDDLWVVTKALKVTPVFAPHTPPASPHLSEAARAAGTHLTADHRPVGHADRPLVPRGQSRRGVALWACPLANKTVAPCPAPCAKAHRLVSVNFRGTRYDEMGLPYRSPQCHTVDAQRTRVERAHSLWETGGVKAARHRRPYLWYGRLVIAAITQHLQAWVRHAAAPA